MKKLFSFCRRPLPMLFFSALFAALPLSFPSLFLLSWVAFVPFFFVILKKAGQKGWCRALGRGVFFGFFYHFFVYFWFVWLYPLDFAGLDTAASLGVIALAWPGISLLHGSLFAIPTLLCHFLSKKVSSRSFLLFSASMGILAAQRITETTQLAFPWVKVSLGQYRATALIQSVSLFGMEGLDLLILSTSALLALALVYENKKRLMALCTAGVLFASNLLFGTLRLLLDRQEGEVLTATAVQGCILSGEKWNGENSAFETYVSLTEEETAPESDLVVWPESAVTSSLYDNEYLIAAYQYLSARVDADILMGCFWEIDGQTANSAVLLSPTSVSEPYSKQILVPFGERMPYREVLSQLFPFLSEINMLSDDLAPGRDSALMDFENKKIGTVICFESIFPDLVRKSVSDGAEMIFVVTNDSWYEDSPGVWQHLAQSVFRSVENHRSVVRCANSGVSAFIDEKGRILSELGPLEQGTLTDRVSFSEKTTLFTKAGSVVFGLGCAVLACWLCALLFAERRKRRG